MSRDSKQQTLKSTKAHNHALFDQIGPQAQGTDLACSPRIFTLSIPPEGNAVNGSLSQCLAKLESVSKLL